MNDTAIFEHERPYLKQLAYSFVGSGGDAEDIVQDAFLRWQKGERDNVEQPRAFLTQVVTRLSLDHLKSARVRRETYVGTWLPEPVIEEVFWDPARVAAPDTMLEKMDTISHALMILLEQLTPSERAAFLLRKIFDLEYSAISATLGKSPAACRQLVKRASDRLKVGTPRFTRDDAEHAQLVTHFAMATTSGNLESLQSILANDVMLNSDHGGKAVSVRRPVYTPDKVGRFFIGLQNKHGAETQGALARINGQLGLVVYEGTRLVTVLTFEVVHGKIQNIWSLRNPDKLRLSPFYEN